MNMEDVSNSIFCACERALAQATCDIAASGSKRERRYAMNRLANISYLILVVVLVGVLGCRSGHRARGLAPRGRPHIDEAVAAEDGLPTGAIELKPAPAPVVEGSLVVRPIVSRAKAGPDEAVNGAEPGSYTVSRVYPCRECGNVQLDKVMPSQAEVNSPLEYSIRVTNLTGAMLSGVVVTEELPEDFELKSAAPTAKQEGKSLVWELQPLAPRAAVEIAVSGVASKVESLKYCTNVATPMAATCSSVQVIEPMLKLAKIAPQGVLLCEPIQIKYVLTNAGTGAAQEVKIVETLPEGLQTADGKSEVVINAGKLTAGQVKEFPAEIKALRVGKYVSKATVSSARGLKGESAATTIVVDQPVIAVSLSGPEKQYVDRAVTYEITVTNDSDAPAKKTVIENEIPDGVTSMKATAGATLAGKKIIWPLGTLAPRASKTVYVSFSPTRAGVLADKATATALCANVASASAETTVSAIPAVLMEVIDIEDPVEVGTRTTYVITVTNQGSAPSTNVSVVCNLEDNVRYVSSTGSTGGTIENGTLTFTPLGSLAPKARATWRVVVTAVKPGDTRFRATMNTDELTRPVEETEATRVYE